MDRSDFERIARQYLGGAVARLADRIDADAIENVRLSSGLTGISMRMVREFDLDGGMPSFDHIPTEAGRAATRRLWVAAHGAPRAPVTARFDVLFGFSTLQPELAAKVEVVS